LGNGLEKSLLNFGSDPAHVLDLVLTYSGFFIFIYSSVVGYVKVKVKLGKPVTVQCRENVD